VHTKFIGTAFAETKHPVHFSSASVSEEILRYAGQGDESKDKSL